MRRNCIVAILPLLLLVGCTQIGIAMVDKYYQLFPQIPPGGRWVKTGMTRDTRLADWVACGGNSTLDYGFREWKDPELWEVFKFERLKHEQIILECMPSKGYTYHYPWEQRRGADQCDDGSCLYP